MATTHPLDCAAWSALTGRQSHLAVVEGCARRFDPAYGVFAAVEQTSVAAHFADLGALVAAYGDVALLQPDPPADVPGTRVAARELGVQMTAERLAAGPAADFEMLSLADADSPDMLALATLTKPGPFFERTHQLGEFFGVKLDGRLVAMAGERMKPDGFTEVSGVCTHPDHRGRGYAGALMRLVARGILDRGETPFLHAYASNRRAIALYEALGFRLRRAVWMIRLARG